MRGKTIIVAAVLCFALVGCGSGVSIDEHGEESVEKDVYTKNTDDSETETEVEEVEQTTKEAESTKLIDELIYEYDENNKVRCSIVKDTEKETFSFLCSIECEDDKVQFSALVQAQTVVSLSTKFDNYVIIYEIEDTVYCTLVEDGKMLKSDVPEIDTNSIDEEQTEKHLEFTKVFDEFLIKNNF